MLAEVIRTIAAVDPAIAQIPQAHFLFVDVLAVHGRPEQQRRLFADVLAGARLGNGVAERGGKHAQDLKTRLRSASSTRRRRRCGWTGGSTTAPARSRPAGSGSPRSTTTDRLVLAFVDRNAPGVTIDEDWDVMGQRATVSGTATFDRVQVEPGLVVPYAERVRGAAAVRRPVPAGAHRDPGRDRGRRAARRPRVRQTKARPFFEATRSGWADTAASDPHTIHRFGRLATQVAAAEALLASAAATLAEVTRFPADAEEAARGSIAVAEAKAFASDTAVEVASDLFSLAGASAADERYDLSRHWRNARTHASHDPVDWKYHHVGNYLLNDALPPNHGQL